MATLREAVAMALEALITATPVKAKDPQMQADAINALRTALDAHSMASDASPVAWMHTNAVGHQYFRKKPHDAVFNPQAVYVQPPRREWLGLTDAELEELSDMRLGAYDLCLEVEARLEEKNRE